MPPSELTVVTLVDGDGTHVEVPIANIPDQDVKREVEIIVQSPKINILGKIVKKVSN